MQDLPGPSTRNNHPQAYPGPESPCPFQHCDDILKHLTGNPAAYQETTQYSSSKNKLNRFLQMKSYKWSGNGWNAASVSHCTIRTQHHRSSHSLMLGVEQAEPAKAETWSRNLMYATCMQKDSSSAHYVSPSQLHTNQGDCPWFLCSWFTCG